MLRRGRQRCVRMTTTATHGTMVWTNGLPSPVPRIAEQLGVSATAVVRHKNSNPAIWGCLRPRAETIFHVAFCSGEKGRHRSSDHAATLRPRALVRVCTPNYRGMAWHHQMAPSGRPNNTTWRRHTTIEVDGRSVGSATHGQHPNLKDVKMVHQTYPICGWKPLGNLPLSEWQCHHWVSH